MRRITRALVAMAVAATVMGVAPPTSIDEASAAITEVAEEPRFNPFPRNVDDAVWDPSGDRVFFRSGIDVLGYDPESGEEIFAEFVEPPAALGSMAMADDGSVLWIALRGLVGIVAFPIDAPGLPEVYLPEGDFGDATGVTDLHVLPGDPGRVLAALDQGGVLLFEDGVLQPNRVSGIDLPSLARVDETSAVALGPGEDAPLFRLDIDENGVTTADGPGGISTGASGESTTFVHADGRIFTDRGEVIDAETGDLLLSLPIDTPGPTPVVRDGEVYYFADETNTLTAYAVDTGAVTGVVEFHPDPEPALGVVVTATRVLVWDDGGTRDLRIPEPAYLTGEVRLDLRGTPFRANNNVTFCIDVVDAETGELLVEGTASIIDEYRVRMPTDVPVKLLYWDCDGFGVFPSWYDDVSIAYFEQATALTFEEGDRRDIDVFLDPFFVDVDFDAYYFVPVVFLRNTDITTGCAKLEFCPDGPVTREQMAAFVARFWRFLGGECSGDPSPFGDVGPTSFAYFDVGCIADIGVTTGTGTGTYSPSDVVTREQMAAFVARLWRALDLPCPGARHPFTDINPASFAAADVSCIFHLGITTGTTATTYSPDDPVTRGQLATFLQRLFLASLERT